MRSGAVVNLPLFDPPSADFAASFEAAKQADRSDVLRIIQHKCGPFREVLAGKETGREYRVLDLQDGRRVVEFMDGSRVKAPAAFSDIYILDGLHYKSLIEVALC
jgi:hypothetical protein